MSNGRLTVGTLVEYLALRASKFRVADVFQPSSSSY